MNLADRIKEIRKVRGLKQSELADACGVKAATVTSWETGTRNPSESVLLAICRVYGINEEWLRDGSGEMFTQITRDEQIEEFIGEMLRGEEDSFKKRLVSVLARLSEDEWKVLEGIAEKVSEKEEQ